jgi:GNAT superfamily N-acetyltransferase
MTDLDIRLARADDRQDLIELLWRASLAWDVVRQDLLDNPEVIDVDPEMIARNQVFVAEWNGRIVGFATIIPRETNDGEGEGHDAELEGIFVEPSDWRKGIGIALLRQIEREAQAWGANRLLWSLVTGLWSLGQVTSFRPTMPDRIRPIEASRSIVAGSPSRTMPRIAVPIAPIPVHTA